MRAVASLLLLGSISTFASAQTKTLPLPPNYRTTLDNPDVLVMKVHYGAHEFVPMHDHTAFPTVYLYLNNSGEVQLKHEGENGFVATRPPTHTGAWRISPGMAERHSVQSLSDTPSDFLRIELKGIPKEAIQKVSRADVSSPRVAGTQNEFMSEALQIDRITCPANAECTAAGSGHDAVLAAIVPARVKTAGHWDSLQPGDVVWIPAGSESQKLSPGGEFLRVVLLYK